MFIKTRASVLGSSYDIKYPYIGQVYNDNELRMDCIDACDSIRDIVSGTSAYGVLPDKDFIVLTMKVCALLKTMLISYVTPIVRTAKSINTSYLLFTDKRIGLVGIIDSNYDVDHPFMASLKCKHSFDIRAFTSATDSIDIADTIFRYADMLVKWIQDNNYTARSIIWNPSKGRYTELVPVTPGDSRAQSLIRDAVIDVDLFMRPDATFTKLVTTREVLR